MALPQSSYVLLGLTGLLFLVVLAVSLARSGRRRARLERPELGLLSELVWALVPAVVLGSLLLLLWHDHRPRGPAAHHPATAVPDGRLR
jgi:hypothetical protein